MAKEPPPIWIEPFTSEQEVYLWMLFYGLAVDDADFIEQALVQILDRCPATQHAKMGMMKRGYRSKRLIFSEGVFALNFLKTNN